MNIVPFQQTTVSGCASHSLANFFYDKRYIKGIDKLVVGESTTCLNRKLQKLKADILLDTIFCTQSIFTKQANRLKDPVLFDMKWNEMPDDHKRNWAKPYLVVFRQSGGMNHCILVFHDFLMKHLVVVDSVQSYIEAYKIEEFINKFHIIEVLHFTLVSDRNPENCVYVEKKQFTHIF
jgi:hypothetical protein